MIEFIRFSFFDFLAPNWLYLLCFVPILLFIFFRKEKSRSFGVRFTYVSDLQRELNSLPVDLLRRIVLALKIFFFILLVMALAHPFTWEKQKENAELDGVGIDILFVQLPSLPSSIYLVLNPLPALIQIHQEQKEYQFQHDLVPHFPFAFPK